MFEEAFTYRRDEKREDVCVLLDIGNGSVGGSLVHFAENAKPKIVYSVRYPIHIPDKPSSSHLLEKMTRLLEDVVKDLAHNGAKHLDFKSLKAKDIKHVFCIFSSPWYSSKTKIFRIERAEPMPVTDEFVHYLLDRESATFEKSIGGTGNGALSFIEKKVLRTRLNGYETKMPYDQVARQIELGVFMSMVPQAVLDHVGKIVNRHFSARHIEYNSFALMTYSIIEDLFPTMPNYIFLDVTSEVTELSIVRNNLVTDTVSFANGKNAIMRGIAARYGVSPDVAATYLKLHVSGHADKKLGAEVAKAIKAAGKEWIAGFEAALAEGSKGHFIPGRIFMTSDDDVSHIYSGFIASSPRTEEPAQAKAAKRAKKEEPLRYNVAILNKNVLAHFCTFGRGSSEDAFLAIESIYFNKMFHL